MPGFGLVDVAFPLGASRVRIVYHESLLGTQTGVDKLGFLIARVELVQGDVDVGTKEVVEVKGGFAAGLDADEYFVSLIKLISIKCCNYRTQKVILY
ncbi:hypothetical protein [Haliscomenobacter sp.]|uniref:hypothetical protein n=1 Tax=Haliscomenobacter sp. TaxID=2717303 RepID=UPI00359430AD